MNKLDLYLGTAFLVVAFADLLFPSTALKFVVAAVAFCNAAYFFNKGLSGK